MNIGKRNRKAISPVLATVILIAITLIAAIAIAGFVFGLFGSFTSTAQISAAAVSCYTGGAGHEVNATYPAAGCLIQLNNTGNSAGSGTSCSFTGTGGGIGTQTPPTVSIPNGGHRTVYCAAPGSLSATLGASVSGAVSLSNGGSALFTGTWN